MSWPFKDTKLNPYEYGLAVLPLALAAVGGLLGGLCGAGAVACNLYLIRSKLRKGLKYGLTGLVSVVAVGVYIGLSKVLTLHIGLSLTTADTVDRELQNAPAFVALKKADPGAYTKLIERLASTLLPSPEMQKTAVQVLTTAINAHAPRASEQVVIDRARVLTLQLDQIGAKSVDACFYYLYPNLSSPIEWKQYVTPEVQKLDENVTVSILETASANPQPVPDRTEISKSLTQVVRGLVSKFGEDDVASLGKQARADHAKLCSMNSAFFKEILSLPRKQAVPLLRFLFAQQPSA